MSGKKKLVRGALTLLLAVSFFLPAGCGTETEVTRVDLNQAELSVDDCLSMTLINASGRAIGSVEAEWDADGEETREFHLSLLQNGSTLEPDDVVHFLLPENTGSFFFFITTWETAEDGLIDSYLLYGDELRDGGILVLPPDDEYDVQVLFEPGTDPETAKQATLEAYQAAWNAEHLPQERAALSAEEAQEAAQRLGYASLEDMRTRQHPDLSEDYSSYTSYDIEREGYHDFYELSGYWYPDGDRNSLHYFSVSSNTLHWYEFDPEEGDVETGCWNIVGRVMKSYRLDDGRKLTMSGSGLTEFVTGVDTLGTLQFDGDDTEYHFSES